jgi:predicted RNA binding protein YcfA (HicA-like mRNA interferase family)
MVKLARLTGQQVIVTLKRAGFEVLRIKGSHHFLAHIDGGEQLFLFIGAK